ncbi:MAG: capsule assembly Wzi family protein [Gemmatimonadota bacterium]
MPRSSATILVAVVWACSAFPLAAQTLSVGDPRVDYLRVLQVAGLAETGSFTLRPVHVSSLQGRGPADPWGLLPDPEPRRELTSEFWASGVGGELQGFFNSAFPMVRNDGAVWQGKGLTTAVHGGGTLGWGRLSLTVRPTLVHARNGEFPLGRPDREGDAVYRYPWSRHVDLPQRFGPDPVTFLDPGQTSFRVSAGGLSLGAGTENLWWGPGVTQSLQITNNAAGFPHVDLRTERPLQLGPLKVEGQWLWGRLGHSEWFDTSRTTRDRFFTGAMVALSPNAVPGLTVGMTRTFYQLFPDASLPASELFLIFQRTQKKAFVTPDDPQANDTRDQMASFFGRWAFPESGLELYGEWGRNDHGWDVRDYLTEPEHSSAYVLGLRKVSHLEGPRLLVVTTELTRLERSTTWTVRATPTWYVHFWAPQGYTQKGQVIGAGVGPGGNAQFLGGELYHSGGKAGAFIQRRIQNNDYFYQMSSYGDFPLPHHTSVDFGLQWLGRLAHGLEVEAEGILTRETNRYYELWKDLWNAHLTATLRWRMR